MCVCGGGGGGGGVMEGFVYLIDLTVQSIINTYSGKIFLCPFFGRPSLLKCTSKIKSDPVIYIVMNTQTITSTAVTNETTRVAKLEKAIHTLFS